MVWLEGPKSPNPLPHPWPNLPQHPLVWGLQEGWRGIPEPCPCCAPRKGLEAQQDLSSSQNQTSPSMAAAVPPIFLLAAKLLISLLFSESIEMTILKQLQMC